MSGYFITACQNEDDEPTKETGFVKLNLGLSIENAGGKIAAVNTDGFNVVIYNASDDEIYYLDDYIDIPDAIELEEGDYYAFASSDDLQDVAFDAPYYAGTSATFTIVKGEEKEVAVNTELANVKVTVNYSAAILADFTDWETTVAATSGALVFVKDEIRSGYFLPGEDLSVMAELTFTKEDLTLGTRSVSGTITETEAKDHYVITIDYLLENGAVSPLLINVDETTNDIVVNLSGSNSIFPENYGSSSSDVGFAIRPTPDNGFIVAGYASTNDGDVSEHNGSSDFWVFKLDSFGNMVWEKTYGGSGSEFARAIELTSDGGYIVVGESNSSDGDVSNNQGQHDYWAIKLDAVGNLEWESSFGGSADDHAISVVETPDGYAIAGNSLSSDGDITSNHGGSDYWVIKIDDLGNLVWESSFGGEKRDQAFSIKALPSNGFVVAGESNSIDGNVSTNLGRYDIWVVQIDDLGNLVNDFSFGGTGTETGVELISTGGTDFVIAGMSNSSDGDLTVNNGGYDYWVIKFNAINGALIWQKTFGGSGIDYGRAITHSGNGGFVITGSSTSSDGDITTNNGGTDFWTIKIDGLGNLVWQSSHGGSRTDIPRSVCTVPGGGFAVVGETNSEDGDITENIGSRDVWVVKLDANGNL